ncbi:MAG: sugar phosphate isomerase/epimerase family protein [Acetobacteraceae bacterium]
MPVWRFGYQANCWGPLGGHPVGVTSIKDLTYKTFGDIDVACVEIAAAGYSGVEIFDGNLVDYPGGPGALATRLAELELTLIAVYSGANFVFPDVLGEELARIDKVAALAAEAGASHLVVGGGAKRTVAATDEDYRRLGEALGRVVGIAARHGLEAHYHPHLTTLAETPEQVARVLSLSPIHFCPDTGHLAAAGGNAAAMIDQHFQRVHYVHLKGWQREPFAFTPLDRGDLDLKPVIDTLHRRGFAGWITVELDAWPSPRAGAEASRAWLRQAIDGRRS